MVINTNVYMRAFNQYKYENISNSTNKKTADLVLLTVTGDERYKNYYLTSTYKNLQIIHLLVISGSNISILLSLVNLFIYRKNMKIYLFSLVFIYIYGKLIFFPETILRAFQTLVICNFSKHLGMKVNQLLIFLTTLIVAFLTLITGNVGFSYQLSFIFFSLIFFNSNYLEPLIGSKIISFLTTTAIMTVASTILFNKPSFSINCTSYIANIFITYIYEFAIKLAYITYFLPNINLFSFFFSYIEIIFNLVFDFLNLMQFFTYNICNEKFF